MRIQAWLFNIIHFEHVYCALFIFTYLDYIQKTGEAIYSAMTKSDSKAVWVMQAWLFLSNFWQEPQIKAILSSTPLGSMILLDLDSTYREQYSRTKSYFGQPFIFNDLNNFGGSIGLFGRFDNINQRPFEARHMVNSTMIGKFNFYVFIMGYSVWEEIFD